MHNLVIMHREKVVVKKEQTKRNSVIPSFFLLFDLVIQQPINYVNLFYTFVVCSVAYIVKG